MRASLFGGCFSEIQLYQILRLFCPNSCPFFREKLKNKGKKGTKNLTQKRRRNR
jgi:hypothetical protein